MKLRNFVLAMMVSSLAVTASAYAWAFHLGYVGSLAVHLPLG